MALSDRDQEILAINQSMLESVVGGDWPRYATFCAADLSCFEAETNGHLVEGLPFHQYYFNLPASATPATAVTVTMARPHLRWLSDNAVVLSYTRLTQGISGGEPITASCCETRIWHRQNDQWQQVHVHRS